MVLAQKWPFFQLFFFRQYKPGQCVLQYSRTQRRLSKLKKQRVQTVKKLRYFRKIAYLPYRNKKFKKSKNWDFSKGVNPWFWSKNCNFSNFFFFGNIVQKNVFYNILEQKNDFPRHKNKKFKMSKNWDFSDGVNPWFWSKKGHFSNFFFLAI